MTAPEFDLPSDLAGCHAMLEQLAPGHQRDAQRIAQMEAELTQHQATVTDLQETIATLQADNKLLRRSIFGSRRERFVDPDQRLLFSSEPLEDEGSSTAAAEQPKRLRRQRTSKGRGPRVLPDFLPREEERIALKEEEIPEEMRDNPDARRFYKKTGERLEWTPGQFRVIEVFQETIALDQANGETRMVRAAKPQLINSFVGPSVWSYLTVSRFADHLPYYRLEDIFARGGLRIDRSTQWRWMRRLAEGVTPLVDLMWERVLRSSVLGVDETPVKMLGPPGTTQTAYLWAAVGDATYPYDCFFFTPDRRAIRPQAVLSEFEGYLVADAYVAYEQLCKLRPEVVKVACWAHGRRKFEEVHHLGATERTHTALAFMQRLFDIEDSCSEYSAQQRFEARQERSRPIVDAFRQWLDEQWPQTLPKSKLRGAMNYLLNRWESFTRYLECGAVPIHNNQTEATLKYAVLGRKAWLFVGNQEAGHTAAKLFTLTKTCNRLRIDPYAYLQDVYTRLPTTSTADLASLLPDRWIHDHPQHVIQARVQEALDRARRKREERAARRAAA